MPTCFVYVFFPSPSSLSNIPCRGIKKNISFHFLTRFVAAFTPLSSVFYCLDPFPLLLALSQLRSLRKILHRSFFEIIAQSSSQFYFYWLFFVCNPRMRKLMKMGTYKKKFQQSTISSIVFFLQQCSHRNHISIKE